MKHIYKNITQGVCRLPSSKSLLASAVCLLMAQSAFSLEALSDSEMAKKSGKEFLTMQSIGPNDLGNPNGNVGFYRLNMDAKLELNANLDKLRLGCDTPANDSACDISIDKVSFTGIVPKVRTGYDGDPSANGNEGEYNPNGAWQDTDGDGKFDSGIAENTHNTLQDKNDFPVFGTVLEKFNYTKNIKSGYFNPKDTGPITDFVMNKPFIEVAIENPNSLTDRRVVGYRFGAHEVWGAMSTGQGPLVPGTNLAAPVNLTNRDGTPMVVSVNGRNLSAGEAALDAVWSQFKNDQSLGNEAARFSAFQQHINDDIERGHTGVNSISGRLPVRLDNLNVNARVLSVPVIGDTHAQTAIFAGSLSRDYLADNGTNGSFGRDELDPLALLNGLFGADGEDYSTGYLRNTYLGDRDTNYDPATYGNYVANDTKSGRALEFKRATRALLDNMIVRVHETTIDIGAGDRYNTQDISLKTFHQLQFGIDINNNLRYDPGEGSKHFAFQYQSLDGLQWITTDKRFGDEYDNMGNVVAGEEKPINGGGYDWLSTRAGWWLESPMAYVMDAYVPPGQTANLGVPDKDIPIQLKSLDLGARPVDNCYGNLTFC